MRETVSREYAKKLSKGWWNYSRTIRRYLLLMVAGLLLATPVLYWAWHMAPVPPVWVQAVLIVGMTFLFIGLAGMFTEWKPFVPDIHED
jgi:sterol desaturase/sphingolipid hydroxylase (fatty acid hydroxylase superfamily)